MPPLRDLMLCRKLEMGWHEMRAMPEDVLEVWEAFLAGEAHGEKARMTRG